MGLEKPGLSQNDKTMVNFLQGGTSSLPGFSLFRFSKIVKALEHYEHLKEVFELKIKVGYNKKDEVPIMKNIGQDFPYGELTGSRFHFTIGDRVEYQLDRKQGVVSVQRKGDGQSTADSSHETLIIPDEVQLYFIPLLPSVPLAVPLNNPVMIHPKSSYGFSLPLPLVPSVAVSMEGKRFKPLLQYPLMELSKTWVGDCTAGQEALAYSADVNQGPNDPFEASCSIEVENVSNDMFNLDKLTLRVPYFSLYRKQNRLYTSRVKFKFLGKDQALQEILESDRDIKEEYNLICGPMKNKPKKIQRGLHFIRDIARS